MYLYDPNGCLSCRFTEAKPLRNDDSINLFGHYQA